MAPLGVKSLVAPLTKVLDPRLNINEVRAMDPSMLSWISGMDPPPLC